MDGKEGKTFTSSYYCCGGGCEVIAGVVFVDVVAHGDVVVENVVAVVVVVVAYMTYQLN